MRTVPPPHLQTPFLKIEEHFSIPKYGKADFDNEDAYRASGDKRIIALSDGATDKSGIKYPLGDRYVTGGRLASHLVINSCVNNDRGNIVNAATEALRSQYEQYNPRALKDSAARCGATLLDARITKDAETGEFSLAVTQIGDSCFRLTRNDGTQFVSLNKKKIDEENALIRAEYIEKHPYNIEGGRAAIMDRLRMQHQYQNSVGDPEGYGYGVIDGSPVPKEYVHVFFESLENVRTLELFSDGYDVLPSASSLAAFEHERDRQNIMDPHHIGENGYPPATKTDDDRTYIFTSIQY
jgi:hypothetical protein